MALAREAALLIDNGEYKNAAPLVNGLKAEGVEIALAACDAAMRAHGALCYSNDVDLGDRVRDLMGLRIADGTTDVMRMTVVKAMPEHGEALWNMAIRSYQDPSKKQIEQTPRQNTSASPDMLDDRHHEVEATDRHHEVKATSDH